MNIELIVEETKYRDQEHTSPEPSIMIQDKIISTPGNFITINGLPKNYKTTIMQFFIYSALSSQEIFNIKLNCQKHEKVSLIDTEQGIYDFYRQSKRLKFLLKSHTLPDNFSSHIMRKYEPEVILKCIDFILKTDKPKFLFIDNLTELVNNPNDMLEAKNVIQKLKTWTAEHNTTIICLLHLGRTNQLSLGNLGSFADRAAQSALKVSHDKDSDIITLEPTLMRSDKWFNPILIKFDEEQKTFILSDEKPKQNKSRKFVLMDISHEDHLNRLGAIYRTANEFIYAEIVEELKKIYGVGTNTAKQVIIPYLTGNKYLNSTKGIYTFNPTRK